MEKLFKIDQKVEKNKKNEKKMNKQKKKLAIKI